MTAAAGMQWNELDVNVLPILYVYQRSIEVTEMLIYQSGIGFRWIQESIANLVGL